MTPLPPVPALPPARPPPLAQPPAALDAGADVVLAQDLAGYRSPDTTARYDRRPEAARLVLVPWQGAFH